MKDYFKELLEILNHSIESIDEDVFEQLVNECTETLKRGNKIVLSGLGKNVPVCEKFVGSVVSMGLDACFMNTNSATHGDLGLVHTGDLVIILTKSGSTTESVYLYNLLKQRDCTIWLLTFKKESVLADQIEKTLVVDLTHEGDKWNILPNNSTTLNLIVLQMLAMRLAETMDVTLEQFKPNHPGGAIGDMLKDGK